MNRKSSSNVTWEMIAEWLKARIEDAVLELAKAVFERDLFDAVIDSFGAKYSK